MSTASMIARETPSGIEAIYTHGSGYPEHQLPLLTKHYATDEAIEALMKLGDLSVLGSEIGRKHDFDGHGKDPETRNWCLSYWRDRGEEDTGRIIYSREDVFLAAARREWADYVYLFRRDGRWYYRNLRKGAEWQEAKS
jgi:hypothetical protein